MKFAPIMSIIILFIYSYSFILAKSVHSEIKDLNGKHVDKNIVHVGISVMIETTHSSDAL